MEHVSLAFVGSLRRPVLCLFSLALFWGGAGGTFAQELADHRESIEWCDLWLTHANKTNLPRVLLIGDSIARAYAPEVEKLLAGKAYVNRLATSAFISDPMLLQEIKLVLDHYSFEVVQFNNGMHGWHHSEAEYRAAFPAFLKTIQEHARGAKLIWADTTPVKDERIAAAAEPASATNQAATNVSPRVNAAAATVSNERIAARNAIAHDFLRPKQIPIVDLNSPLQGHPEYHTDNVHFKPVGIAIQAQLAAKEISALLSGK